MISKNLVEVIDQFGELGAQPNKKKNFPSMKNPKLKGNKNESIFLHFPSPPLPYHPILEKLIKQTSFMISLPLQNPPTKYT